jgi:malate synthase
MTTRPKRRKKAARKRAKKPAGRKSAAGQNATLKTRGAKPARRRKAGAAPPTKAARTKPKTVRKTVRPKPADAPRKAEGARRQLALLGSGRRPKVALQRGPARGRVGVRPRIAKPARRAPRVPGVAVKGAMGPRYAEVLTPAALRFLAELHRAFEAARQGLLAARAEHQRRHDADELPDLQDGRVESAAAADRKMIVDALNSGADACVADFADAWAGRIEGQINLKDRWAGKLDFVDPASREHHKLADSPAPLIVRPRGWHRVEQHLTVDGAPVAGALFDFALYLFHNAQAQSAAGTGLYFYLPDRAASQEARLWHEVFAFAQERLGIPDGRIRVWSPGRVST